MEEVSEYKVTGELEPMIVVCYKDWTSTNEKVTSIVRHYLAYICVCEINVLTWANKYLGE